MVSLNNIKQKSRPLDGVKVISFEHAIAAPFCTRQLAELGARVIKIERPVVGDFARQYDTRVNGLSSHFVWTNRSKESLTVNLKTDEGIEIINKLLIEADVFIQNLAPGAADRMGFSFEELHKKHPKLIVCDITGYGQGGPYEQKKAYDLLIQSEGGFLSVTGGSEQNQIAKAGCSIADIAAGMYAYSSILSALIHRDKTGSGSYIDVSMLESLVEWMGYPMYYAYEEQLPPPRTGASHATIYPYGPFPIGDGNIIMLGLQNEREWQSFCNGVLNAPELVKDPRFITNYLRVENRKDLQEIIIDSFSKLNLKEVMDRLEKAAIANAQVNKMKDVWEHQQLAARNRWTKVDTTEGEISALLPPATNSSFDARIGPVPGLGQHTDLILEELGFSSKQIAEFYKEGVV